jgi:hypothetical protein
MSSTTSYLGPVAESGGHRGKVNGPVGPTSFLVADTKYMHLEKVTLAYKAVFRGSA